MSSELLDTIPLWVLIPAMTVLLWLTLEAGVHFGRLRRATEDERGAAAQDEQEAIRAMMGPVLALLALILGFTFSLALNRFDDRRQTVLEEANAIGTTYLRARLLPQPEHEQSTRLLREYVAVRAHATRQTVPAALARSELLQQQLWAQAVSAADKAPNNITGLFVASLNEMIDVHAKRILVALRSRIPAAIWLSLFAMGLVGMGAVGYQTGYTRTRRMVPKVATVVTFAAVLWLIADLDRAGEGLLRVGPQALLDVEASMGGSG